MSFDDGVKTGAGVATGVLVVAGVLVALLVLVPLGACCGLTVLGTSINERFETVEAR